MTLPAAARVCTIGFTRTSAERFFARLAEAGVRQMVDVRLHNSSQLAGFAKADDLAFFLQRLGGIVYRHEPLLAPTDDMLKTYRAAKNGWATYEQQFFGLMAERRIEDRLKPDMLDRSCLLCSEATADQCHRRLVCDYLNGKWGGTLEVRHL